MHIYIYTDLHTHIGTGRFFYCFGLVASALRRGRARAGSDSAATQFPGQLGAKRGLGFPGFWLGRVKAPQRVSGEFCRILVRPHKA